MYYPELIITESPLENLFDDLFDSNTLIVTDPYNYPLVSKYGQPVIVRNNFYSISYNEIKNNFHKVIGIGGCSALDVGRAFAEDKSFIAIPTILSTSCISVNISILRTKDKTQKLKTTIPLKTIVSLPALLSSDKKDLENWSASGFGDLFANISAAIDFEYKNKSSSLENIYSNGAEAFKAMEWVISSFKEYNNITLSQLATYLHNSSIDVIKRGNNELSAGCEHSFYEAIIRQEKYSNHIQTHGKLVAIGTLIAVMIFEEKTNNNIFFSKLKKAYKKLGLPINYDDFENIGIKKEDIINALKKIPGNNIISDYFIKGDYSILENFNK